MVWSAATRQSKPDERNHGNPENWGQVRRVALRKLLSDTFAWFAGGQEIAPGQLKDRAAAVLVRVAGAGLMFTVAVALARFMGPAGYGNYSFAIALISILAVFAQLGLPTLLVRETAKYRSHGQWDSLRGLIRRSAALVTSSSALICALLLLVTALFAEIMPAQQKTTVTWALVLIPLISYSAIVGAALRGSGKIVTGQVPDQILRPGLILLLLVAMVVTAGPPRIESVVGIKLYIIATILSLATGVLLLRIALPNEYRAVSASYADSKRWQSSILPLGLLAGFQVVISQIDTLILGIFVAPSDVGIYRVAWQGASLVNLILFAIGLSIEPQIARMHAEGRHDELQSLVKASGRIAFLIASVITLFYIVFGEWLIEFVFGARYAESYMPLVILAAGQVGFSISGWSAIVLNMTGNEKSTANITGYAALANVIANFVLVPTLGIYGAALATCLTLTFWKLALALAARRHANIDTIVISANRYS
jgi:O-antigen/teichoic acid export membrane protein